MKSLREFFAARAGLDEEAFLKGNPGPFLLVSSLGAQVDPQAATEEIKLAAALEESADGEQDDRTRVLSSDLGLLGRLLFPVEKREGASGFASLVTVGRAVDNDIVLSSSEISKYHACFTRSDSGWTVHDVGSRNGTFVGDERLKANAKTAVTSEMGICFGQIDSLFLSSEQICNLRKLC